MFCVDAADVDLGTEDSDDDDDDDDDEGKSSQISFEEATIIIFLTSVTR